LIVRSALPPVNVMSAVRSAVQSLDGDQPVFAIETVAQVFAGERSIYRIFATLFAVLAAIGLVLSAVGVYGVMAYAVAQRTQEIGVRMAIGARRWDVSWLFLRRGLTQLAMGSAIGLPAAFALGMLARFQLVEVEPGDPVTFAGIVIVIGGVAVAACLIPARRAAQVDPVNALRAE
jgi:putative ABC transport system permease protein